VTASTPTPARGRDVAMTISFRLRSQDEDPRRHRNRDVTFSAPDGSTDSMDERDWLAERFQAHRPRLHAVAYRTLGSVSEADDAVQEAWIRLSRSNTGEIDNLEAWLVTAVGRVALNMLRSHRTRREEPLDAHLPDPIGGRADGIDPEHEALLADAVGLALLVVLETLTPAE